MQIRNVSFPVTVVLFAVSMLLVKGCVNKNQESSPDHPIAKNFSEESFQSMDRTVVAYYFHGTFRCHTCLKIEELTKEAIKNYFPDELESGNLGLKIINFDEPENKHFEDLFQLEKQSVIIAVYHNEKLEKWKNLPKIWELYDSEETFFDYIHEEIMLIISEK